MDNEHQQLELTRNQKARFRRRIIACEKYKSANQGEVIPLKLARHSFPVVDTNTEGAQLGKLGSNRRKIGTRNQPQTQHLQNSAEI